MVEKDYYKILGITKEATPEEIKKAFKQLAKKYHPDVNQKDKGAEEKFKEVNEAFQILGNPQKKAQYDHYGNSAFSAEDINEFRNQKFNFEDIFEDFNFGDIFNLFKNKREKREYEEGADLRYDLEISLEEAFSGIKKIIEIPLQEICKDCNGSGAKEGHIQECDKCNGTGEIRVIRRQGHSQFISVVPCNRCNGLGKIATKHCETCNGKGRIQKIQKIEVKIPRGISHGQYLRIEGKGGLGRNAPSGDLYVIIHIRKHAIFKMEEKNLFLDRKIDLKTAIFGGKIEIQGIDKKIKLKIPPATQSHSQFKLKGQGMPSVNSRRGGDLFVKIIVDIPKVDSDREKLFKKFLDLI